MELSAKGNLKMKKYSEKELYDLYKPSELCFIVATKASYIDESSSVIDTLKEAMEVVGQDEHIYIYTRKKIVDYLDPDSLYQNLIDDMESEGVLGESLESLIGRKGKEDFKITVTKFLKRYVRNAWLANEVIGVLEE